MIAVLADDFTGAAEIAGCASRSGHVVHLNLSIEAVGDSDPGDFVIVDTDTRLLSAGEAGERVTAAVKALQSGRPRQWYKKIDSVLRGNVFPEIEAMLAGLPSRTNAIVAAANPARGRCIRGGQYEIDGVPLHRTNFKEDPFHPARSACVESLVGGAPSHIRFPDIENTFDLQKLAESMDRNTLAAGASEFFCAVFGIPESSRGNPHLPPGGKRLWVSGSRATLEYRRDQFEVSGISMVEAALARDWLTGASAALQQGREVALECPREKVCDSSQLLSELVDAFVGLMATEKPDQIFVEGGATARACADGMGWTSFQVGKECAPGVVALRPVESPGSIIVVKPGSYLWPREWFTGVPEVR